MKPKLLIILSPPRSFSSVVSTMIGQHPELYCFPELHLFVADTVGQILDREERRGRNYAGPPGVLRALAQLHHGKQTTGTIIKSGAWLLDRRDWSVKELVDHLLEQVSPMIGVEKSPVTCMNPGFIRRAYSCYPDACYLHLTRHPVSTCKSMEEYFNERKRVQKRGGRNELLELDNLLIWYAMHRNVYEFASILPPGQFMRIKGEDLLSAPDVYLPQVADWLGVRTDLEAIDDMMHPENSPYACVGPAPARSGNDVKFMRSPQLRPGRVKEPSLSRFLDETEHLWLSAQGEAVLGEIGVRFRSDAEVVTAIEGMAQKMGYE